MNEEEILKLIKDKIKSEDEKYKASKQRKNEDWMIHSYVFRKLHTKHGTLKIKITRYYKKVENKTITKLFTNDYLLNNKFSNVDLELKKYIKLLYYKGLSSYKILSLFGNCISPRNISLLASKSENNKQIINYKSIAIHKKIVYLDIDDGYLRVRQKDKKVLTNRFRMITAHLGFEENFKKIIGKTTILEIRNKQDLNKKNNQKWANYLIKKVHEIYGDHLQIQVLGDGARWIKMIAKKMKCTYILDYFHMKSKGQKVLGYTMKKYKNNYLLFNKIEKELGFKFYKKYSDIIDKFHLKRAINLLNAMVNTLVELPASKVKELQELAKYLQNNLVSSDNYSFKNGYIGCHTETWISHNIKAKIKRKFSTFGINSIKNILLNNQEQNLNYIFV